MVIVGSSVKIVFEYCHWGIQRFKKLFGVIKFINGNGFGNVLNKPSWNPAPHCDLAMLKFHLSKVHELRIGDHYWW